MVNKIDESAMITLGDLILSNIKFFITLCQTNLSLVNTLIVYLQDWGYPVNLEEH